MGGEGGGRGDLGLEECGRGLWQKKGKGKELRRPLGGKGSKDGLETEVTLGY